MLRIPRGSSNNCGPRQIGNSFEPRYSAKGLEVEKEMSESEPEADWETWFKRAWGYREEVLYPSLFGERRRGIFTIQHETPTGVFKQDSIDPMSRIDPNPRPMMQIVEQKVSAGNREIFDLHEFLARPLYAHLAHSSPDGPRESLARFSENTSAPTKSAGTRDFARISTGKRACR
jgi:hypothetical protein